jgi:hypothetical protein
MEYRDKPFTSRRKERAEGEKSWHLLKTWFLMKEDIFQDLEPESCITG